MSRWTMTSADKVARDKYTPQAPPVDSIDEQHHDSADEECAGQSSLTPSSKLQRRRSSTRTLLQDPGFTRALVAQACLLVAPTNDLPREEVEEDPTNRFNRISSSQHSRRSGYSKKSKLGIKREASEKSLELPENKKGASTPNRSRGISLPSSVEPFRPIDWDMETLQKDENIETAREDENDIDTPPCTICPTKIDYLQLMSMGRSNHQSIDDDHWIDVKTSSVHNDCEDTVMAVEGRHPVLAEVVDLLFTLLRYLKNRCWKKKILTIFIVFLFILVIVDLLFVGYIKEWLTGYIDWMEDHIVLGSNLFIGLLIVTTLCFIPPVFLTFSCGYIFAKFYTLPVAVLAATFTCFLGCIMGAMIAFFRARYMMRDLVHLFSERYTIVGAVDRAVTKKGFRVMFLLRLCPLIPFNALNYIGGITGILWEPFFCSLIGILPLQALTVAMGTTAGDFRWNGMILSEGGDDTHKSIRTALIVVGLLFAIVAMIIAYFFAKKELKKEFALQELQAAERRDGKPTDTWSSSSAESWEDEFQDNEADIDETDATATNHGGKRKTNETKQDEEWFWVLA